MSLCTWCINQAISQKNRLVICLLLYILCTIRNTYGKRTNDDDRYPPMWSNAYSKVNRLPLKNGIYQIDPWNYTHRLTMYKELIDIDHCLWTKKRSIHYGSSRDNRGNPVWGYVNRVSSAFFIFSLSLSHTHTYIYRFRWNRLPLQHGWQYSSGRLCVSEPETRIVPNCWWACANFFFSVFPFFGAIGAGGLVTENVRLLSSTNGSNVVPPPSPCTTYRDCQDEPAVKNWKNFFTKVKETASSCTNASVAANGDPLMDELIDLYWKSHTSTIQATARCDDHLKQMSEQIGRAHV